MIPAADDAATPEAEATPTPMGEAEALAQADNPRSGMAVEVRVQHADNERIERGPMEAAPEAADAIRRQQMVIRQHSAHLNHIARQTYENTTALSTLAEAATSTAAPNGEPRCWTCQITRKQALDEASG